MYYRECVICGHSTGQSDVCDDCKKIMMLPLREVAKQYHELRTNNWILKKTIMEHMPELEELVQCT